MEKGNSQLEHGQPMELTSSLFSTYDSGVACCQSQHQYHFDGLSILHEQVRLAAVNRIVCNS